MKAVTKARTIDRLIARVELHPFLAVGSACAVGAWLAYESARPHPGRLARTGMSMLAGLASRLAGELVLGANALPAKRWDARHMRAS